MGEWVIISQYLEQKSHAHKIDALPYIGPFMEKLLVSKNR